VSGSGLVPIADAAKHFRRSTWTLKRWYRDEVLPVVIIQGQWFVPESFLAMVTVSPQPGRAGQMKDIAAEWFAANSPAPAAKAVA
jgi:hypothetical protein